jgi:hypothetical protein
MVDHESLPGRRVGPNRFGFIVTEAGVYRVCRPETSFNQAVLLPIDESWINIGLPADYQQAQKYVEDRKLQP